LQGISAGPPKVCLFEQLTGTDFAAAELINTNFTGTIEADANFTDANLAGANLTNAYFIGGLLSNSDLERALYWRTPRRRKPLRCGSRIRNLSGKDLSVTRLSAYP
jgi:uncharacterized protein YjbI with pentapeptide repeats